MRECARVAHFRAELIPDVGPGLEATDFFDNPPGTGTFSNALHAAVVEVDPDTGEITIQRYVVIDDCGTVINPTIVHGQIVGGTVQGIGGALWEHLAYDDEGQLLSGTLMDYALPTAATCRHVEVVSLCTPSPFTPLGMKGVGEGGAIAPGRLPGQRRQRRPRSPRRRRQRDADDPGVHPAAHPRGIAMKTAVFTAIRFVTDLNTIASTSRARHPFCHPLR